MLDGTRGVSSRDTSVMSLKLSSHPGTRVSGQSPQIVAFGSPSIPGMISEPEALQEAAGGAGLCKDFLGEAAGPLLFFRGDVQNSRSNQELKIIFSFSSQALELWYLRCSRRTLLNTFIHEKMLGFGCAQLWVLLAQSRR